MYRPIEFVAVVELDLGYIWFDISRRVQQID